MILYIRHIYVETEDGKFKCCMKFYCMNLKHGYDFISTKIKYILYYQIHATLKLKMRNIKL